MDLAAQLRGIDNLMMDIATEEEPDMIHALLDYCRRVATRYAFALIECGGHSTSIGEPVAGPDMLSPAHYRKYPWAHEKRMVEELKSSGIILHNHICGNTIPIADDFIATGAQVLEIDHKTDARTMKAKAQGKATLLGNIDTGLLYSGTPAAIEAACREAIDIMAPGGGFILGPGCALGTDTPSDNIHALVESAKKYGQY
jgi:MtaA/CmuA family methyltransferase